MEAQANGLQCICSDRVPAECDITGNVKYIPINEKQWINVCSKKHERPGCTLQMGVISGYEIESSARRLQIQYEELIK